MKPNTTEPENTNEERINSLTEYLVKEFNKLSGNSLGIYEITPEQEVILAELIALRLEQDGKQKDKDIEQEQ